MYVYMYICACIQDVCMYVYRSVYVYTSPGPKYGMECIKCRCSFVRCSLSPLSLSRLSPCLCLSVAIASTIPNCSGRLPFIFW